MNCGNGLVTTKEHDLGDWHDLYKNTVIVYYRFQRVDKLYHKLNETGLVLDPTCPPSRLL